MKRGRAICLFLLLASSFLRATKDSSNPNQAISSGPTVPQIPSATASPRVSLDDIFLWLAGGISNARIARLAANDGVASDARDLTASCVRAFHDAGANDDLIREISGKSGVRQGSVQSKKTVQGKPREDVAARKEESGGCGAFAEIATLAHSKNWNAAEDAVHIELRKSPDSAKLLFVLGTILRKEDRFDEAYDAFVDSAHLDPSFPETHNQLSYLFYRSNDSDNAIAEARTALSIDPANAEAYRYLGLALYSDGHYEAALNAYEKSLEREEENAEVYFDMGIANRDKGDLRQAAVAYRHALRLRPDYWQAHSNLGVVLHDEGKLDESIVEYRAALKLKPEEISVRNNLGNTLCDKEDFAGALAEFKQLSRQDPNWSGGHNCLARVYMWKHDYTAAIQELQAAIAENPEGATERRVLGQALLLAGKDQEAVEVLRKAVELSPDSALGHHYLGTALVNTQQLAEAEQEFRTALKLEPSAQNHYALAACLMALNLYEEALGELEIASRLDPSENLYRARMQEAARMITTTK